MAPLPEADRQKVWRGFMRYLSRQDINDTVLENIKQDIRDAVDATDSWIETNQIGFNTALPIMFKDNASLEQKTLLFSAVALIRVSEDLLRQIFGELD